jgi:hypothetical protein
VGEQAYSKIAYEQASVWEEILRLPCSAALEEGRVGGISMSLEFLVLFFQEKSTENLYIYYPVSLREPPLERSAINEIPHCVTE